MVKKLRKSEATDTPEGYQDLWGSAVTDEAGYYHVDNVPGGNYSITVVTPLGYQADQETREITLNYSSVTVDFILTPLNVVPKPRTRAYWAS